MRVFLPRIVEDFSFISTTTTLQVVVVGSRRFKLRGYSSPAWKINLAAGKICSSG
jgi:hypothetical protein